MFIAKKFTLFLIIATSAMILIDLIMDTGFEGPGHRDCHPHSSLAFDIVKSSSQNAFHDYRATIKAICL